MFWTIIWLMLGTVPAFAQSAVGKRAQLTQSGQMVNEKLRRLVTNHPDPGVKVELNNWIANGTVWISYNSDRMPPEMAAELVSIDGKNRPVLVVNPNFILRSRSFDFKEDQFYKELVIYHEYIHLKEHLTGKNLLPSPVSAKDSKAVEKAMNQLWDGEFSATHAEWHLAKRLGREHLMGRVKKSIRENGETLGFLNAFYQSLIRSTTHHNPAMKTFLEKRYQRELQKLNTQKRRPPRAASIIYSLYKTFFKYCPV